MLASQSPRRRQLLQSAGYAFEVRAAQVDETALPGEKPLSMALRLAVEKAAAVAAGIGDEEVALAADTIVVARGRIYGKPADAEDAVRILRDLVGRNHQVVTAWVVMPKPHAEASISGICRSTVRFREAAEDEIREYVASGEPLDKAGAYAAQGRGRRFLAAVVGPLDNVIGLPLNPVNRALSAFGIQPQPRGGSR